jgi:hypothetical protein
MAMSSISVVGNSLLLRLFRPGKRNYISLIAPVVMVVVFSIGFFQFAKFSSSMEGQSKTMQTASVEVATAVHEFVAGSRTQVFFSETNQPLLFLSTESLPDTFQVIEGTRLLQDRGVIIGNSDGMKMKQSGTIAGVGSDFLAVKNSEPLMVSGILAPTGTLIDEWHIVNRKTLDKMDDPSTRLRFIAEKEIIKGFYPIDAQRSIIPEQLQTSISGFDPVVLGGKTYLPVYLGSAESTMMKEAKLITGVGDRVENFFGNDVIIAGILPETKTFLDELHYVGPEFRFQE